jgi:hypothetical protein
MLELTAYHEAGHAMVAHLLGGKVQLVTVEPDNDDGPARTGDTQVRWKKSLSEQAFARHAIQVCLAGPTAEMIYSGEPYHPGCVPEWAADWQDAWKLAATLVADERQRLQYLEQTAIELYRRMQQDDFWEALAGVADHLLAHETLEGEEFRELISEWTEG